MGEQNIISFKIFHNEEIPVFVNGGLILMFGLSGEANIYTGTGLQKISEEDICIISPMMMYRGECGEDTSILSAYISNEILQMAGWNNGLQTIYFGGKADRKSSICVKVKHDLAKLFHLYLRKEELSQSVSIIIELISFLKQELEGKKIKDDLENLENKEKVAEIMRYVQEHWNENLSLKDMAQRVYISESHLAHLFRTKINMTFTEYVVSVRINHAISELRNTTKSITQIAYDNGFSNVNSFIKYFKRYKKDTPKYYRDNYGKKSYSQMKGISEGMDVLLKYDSLEEQEEATNPSKIQEEKITIDISQKSEKNVNHSWGKLVNLGYAREGLVGNVQRQLEEIQRNIGFEYVRFKGIFDEDMHIYNEDENGNMRLNFFYSDMLFDFLISLNLIPFVELSYIPKKLAKVEYKVFERASYISACKSVEKWTLLVKRCTRHWTERYGLEQVKQWRFTIISYNNVFLPDMPISHEEYLEMYLATYKAIKEIAPEIKVGGPGCFVGPGTPVDMLRRLFADYTETKSMPDFITVQCYPHDNFMCDREFLEFTVSQDSTPSVLSNDADFTKNALEEFRGLLQEYDIDKKELDVEEWASTLWQRDISSDTCFKAAWLIKNALESFEHVDMMGYWLLTDFVEESFVPRKMFHGGYGLLTANGVPKPSYYALCLLKKAGNRYIMGGKNWFVSRKDNEIQIFLYNYCHYDYLYRYRYQKISNPQNAYKVFQNGENIQWKLKIKGLKKKHVYEQRLYITRKQGSAFDKWLEMGQPEFVKQEGIQYLTEISRPWYERKEYKIEEELEIECTLPVHGICLITISE